MDSHLHQSCSMGELVSRCIERGGDRVAFVSEGRPVTYAGFGASLSRFVQALGAYGLKKGDAVACLSSNRVEAFLVVAAGYLMGLRLTNLHPMGSAEDHAFILRDCGAKALFFDPDHYGERAKELTQRCAAVDPIALGPCAFATDILASSATCQPGQLRPCAGADDVCWVVYTGGTTGKPKGVVHTHRTHVALTMTELAEWEWPAKIVFLAITPISHGAGVCIMPTLMRSGTVVLENGFTAAKFFSVSEKHGVTATFLVPTMIYKLLDHAAEADGASLPLELVIYGGAPISPSRLKEALEVFGPAFMQLYGQTEAPNCVTVLRKIDHDPVRYPKRTASCGLPIGDSQVALLDDSGNRVPIGEVGEICVRGPLVMTGYWNRPDETGEAFRHGWLHTGDLARQDEDGYLYIVGRSKDMIITGGFNVYPAEVEEVLTSHDAVSAAAVFGVPDDTWGEAVRAVVVLKDGREATPQDIIAHVRAAKGPIATPKRVDFTKALPLSPLGKPDKKALRALYTQDGQMKEEKSQ